MVYLPRGSMKALQMTEPRNFSITEVDIPVPQAGQVLVKVDGCGLCASSLQLWEGRPWFSYPQPWGAPGHEGWGRIAQLGRDVDGIREGDHVAFLSDQALAEFVVVDHDDVFVMPSEGLVSRFPGEAFACAMNIWERAALQPGERVCVIGIGFLGTVLVRLAASYGFEVYALSKSQSSVDRARRFGATYAEVSPGDLDILSDVKERTGGSLVECVIEATGHQEPLTLAGHLVAEGGRILIAGYHQDGLREVNMQEWNWKGINVINAHERSKTRYLDGMRRAFDAIESGRLSPQSLITHTFTMSEANTAFTTLENRPQDFIKGVFTL